MTTVAMPESHWRRNFWLGLAVGLGVLGLFAFWMTGAFDRFFAQQGLDFLVAETCIRMMNDTLFCGADEIGRWCKQFGTLNAENKAVCAAY